MSNKNLHDVARAQVVADLTSVIGPSAARDVADALGGEPGDIVYNGLKLGTAIREAFNARERAAMYLRLADAHFARAADARVLAISMTHDSAFSGAARGMVFRNMEIGVEYEEAAKKAKVLR